VSIAANHLDLVRNSMIMLVLMQISGVVETRQMFGLLDKSLHIFIALTAGE
jgi:hypothetical protein